MDLSIISKFQELFKYMLFLFLFCVGSRCIFEIIQLKQEEEWQQVFKNQREAIARAEEKRGKKNVR
jgi:hypothetical protein